MNKLWKYGELYLFTAPALTHTAPHTEYYGNGFKFDFFFI
jgi:hypothetical protein